MFFIRLLGNGHCQLSLTTTSTTRPIVAGPNRARGIINTSTEKPEIYDAIRFGKQNTSKSIVF
jgi:hypothetical protein